MTFNSLILIWFDKNQRILPWRNHSEPYKIWLSEIILQQTRVAQGTDYFLKFCDKFPLITDLANAKEQDVLKLWQGLGYYSRARNLHFTAQHLVQNSNGQFPNNFKDLLKLKGIGHYTAAAIASISFKEAVPAIDGNAFRLFARYFDIDLDISQAKTRNYFFDLGKEIIDQNRPGDFNQAVMDLGATICLPNNPKCEICPLNQSCAALANNKINQLPIKSKKIKVKTRQFHFLEISDGMNYLFHKREKKDVWQNLFTFPLIELEEKQLIESNLQDFELEFSKTHQETHLLTHQKLNIHFWKTTTSNTHLKKLAKQLKSEIFTAEQLNDLPFPKPIEKYLSKKN